MEEQSKQCTARPGPMTTAMKDNALRPQHRTSHMSESTGLSNMTRNGAVRTCISRRHRGHRTDTTRTPLKTAGGNAKTSKGKSEDKSGKMPFLQGRAEISGTHCQREGNTPGQPEISPAHEQHKRYTVS